MSENSAFWDNEITGDAASATGWEAPYLSSEKVEILDLLLGNDDQGYVLPEHGFELAVGAENTASMNIEVLSGTAFVKGRLYENTTTATLTIAANASGNPRIDRVILSTNFAAQTIRLDILQGTPGAAPALPALTQDANTWEVSLAYIWVANGATSIPDEEIHDERVFLLSFNAINNSNSKFNNIMNSEFIAMENFYYAGNKYDLPAYWGSGYYASNEPYTKPDQMTRGRAVKITSLYTLGSSYTDGLTQTFVVKPNTMYSIRTLIQVDAGVIGEINIETNSFAPNTISKLFRQSGEWLDNFFYYKTEHDASEMTFSFQKTPNTGDIIYLGQVLVIEGYYPGDYRSFSELLFTTRAQFFSHLRDSYSSETVVWDMETCDPDFGVYIGEDVKALILNSLLFGPSFPSYAGVTYKAYGSSSIEFSNVPYNNPNAASIWVWSSGEVPLIDRKFEVDYLSPGTDNLDVELAIIGIRT